VRHLSYLALLAACLLGTAPLELWLGVRVYRRWRLLFLSLLPGALVGISWDTYAVYAGQWQFDYRYLLGARLAGLPLEEWLFFLVIPTCAVLTLEAVRRCRPGWSIGDEPADADRPVDSKRWRLR
jgi:lycopene cyclase domain-containing protein